jgi:hypothetical protein
MTNNEKAFFDGLREMEDIDISPPLEPFEIMQIYMDVARKYAQRVQLFEFVKRIEQAHGIGVKHGRTKI